MQSVEMANVNDGYTSPSQRPQLETQLQSPSYHPDFGFPYASPLQNSDRLSRWEPLLPYDTADEHRPNSPRQTSKRHGFKDLIQSLWLLEALSLSAGVIFFGVFMFLLVRYDNQLVSKWETDNPGLSRLFRTLPSAVSFLATLMRGAMIYPVASAIGQLKWHYMRRPRRVKAIELMDGASRGYWGAIRLLLSKDCLTSASFGAIILLGSILLGPFLQNTVQQNSNLVELPIERADEVLLPVEDKVDGRGRVLNESAPAFDTGMFSSIQAGWASGARTSDMRESMLPASCSYPYCEWTNFSSIAVSFTCRRADASIAQDRVSLVKYGVSYQANITNLMATDGTGTGVGKITRLSMRATEAIPTSSGFVNYTTASRLPLIGHLGILGYYNGSYEAAECLIYWAVHEFKAFAANMTQHMWTTPIEYNATTTTDLTNTSSSSTQPVRIPGPKTCRYNGTETPCAFEVARTFHHGLQRMLHPFLSGHNGFITAQQLEESFSQRALNFAMLQTETLYGDWVKRLDAGWFPVEGSLANQTSRFLENMVAFMTNNLRSNSGLFVYGAAGSYGPWFAISRRYAVYPGVFLGLSIVFVAVTAWVTRGEPVWKNSALALLYHGFEKSGEVQRGGLETMAGMERAAERRVVSVVDLHDGLGTRLRDGG